VVQVCILKTCDQSLCSIKACKHIDTCLDGITTDHETIFLMLNTLWRCVDNNIDLVAKDQVHQVRRRLLQLVGTCYLDSVLSQYACSTSCCKDTVALSLETFCDRNDILFILIFYSDDHLFVLRKTDSGSDEGFVKSLVKGFCNTKALTCGFHLRSEADICTSDLLKGEYRHLDRKVLCFLLKSRCIAQLFDLAAKDDSCCKRNDRNSGYLADVRYCTAGTRVNLDHIYILTYNDELDIDHTDNMKCLCKTTCVFGDGLFCFLADGLCRIYGNTVSGVDTCTLDMLHDSRNQDVLTIAYCIDIWFIDKLAILVEMEQALKTQKLDKDLLLEAKRLEFPDYIIADLTGKTEAEIKDLRKEYGIRAAYKMVDTCAAEFAAETPYYYSVYGDEQTENEAVETKDKKKILVLGSGPIRIGQGIEFDFCSVHCTWAFAKEGYETIIINNNPETVSTDFDIADKLYFEPLTPEDVENVVNIEKPDGAVVQFGGQTAIKLTEALIKMGVKILGTSAENVDAAEDRELFDAILEKCEIPRPKGHTVFTAEEAKKAANELGYPVLVRPSYVLGGQGMRIAVSDEDVEEYIGIINQIAQEHPILVDKYLMGKEIEVDAVCDGEDILIPGIMEHIERAGIHSGDSISVYPAQTISQKAKETITEYTRRLAHSLPDIRTGH
jgi:hypothetical protein